MCSLVTGVQTCALPISVARWQGADSRRGSFRKAPRALPLSVMQGRLRRSGSQQTRASQLPREEGGHFAHEGLGIAGPAADRNALAPKTGLGGIALEILPRPRRVGLASPWIGLAARFGHVDGVKGRGGEPPGWGCGVEEGG